MIDAMADAVTLNQVLARRAESRGAEVWLTLYERDRLRATLTYGELYETAAIWAGQLQEYGVQPGARVLLLLPTEMAFYQAFWGILLAGAVAVPAYPPVRLGLLDEHLHHLRQIIDNSGAETVILNETLRPLVRPLEYVAGRHIAFLAPGQKGEARPTAGVPVAGEDLALLQYTSGSTGGPKGVMLNHGNLLANLRAIGAGLQVRKDDLAVSWLPLYHDMGLIGFMLGTLYWGVPLVTMSPLDFLRKPVRWLRLISDHHATVTAGPNFAYSLAAQKIKAADLSGIDLSSLRAALCGAEPIQADTIERFMRRFEPLGFGPEVFFPAYGLAENTLAVTFSELSQPPHVESFDAQLLAIKGRAVPRPMAQGGRAMVSVGRPLETVEVTILNQTGHSVATGRQGEVAVRSPSVMVGYFRNPAATAAALRNGWLRTGDIGFMFDGRLYIAGRKKDMVIKGGRNYFAEALETAALSVAGVRPGGICVFAAENPQRGTEDVILAVEVDPAVEPEHVSVQLRKTVNELTGCRPDRILLLPPKSLPKTSSGKLQRYKARQWYLAGTLQNTRSMSKLRNGWIYLKAYVREKLRWHKRSSQSR